MIVLGERPERVKVIRENHDGVDGEGVFPSGLRKRRPQQRNGYAGAQYRRTIRGDDREKEGPARSERTAVIGHGVNVPRKDRFAIVAMTVRGADPRFDTMVRGADPTRLNGPHSGPYS